MKTKQSRRQFMLFSLGVLCPAIAGCRQREETSVAKPPSDPTTGTNSFSKWPDNVAGRFFVNSACIDCDLCKEAAPALFKRNDKEGYCFVYKQPATAAELKSCLEAVEGCPVEAIIDTQKQ